VLFLAVVCMAQAAASHTQNAGGYVTKVQVNDSVRVSLYTASMFRLRISHIKHGNKFPEKYEIPFVIGRLYPWEKVGYKVVRCGNTTEIVTSSIIISIPGNGPSCFEVFDHERACIYPSDGPVYGMFRDGYTVFDNASAFLQMNSNSRFTHWFYSVKTNEYGSVFLKENLIEDTYFIYGPGYKSLFKQYKELVGPEPLLPKKAYGFFQTQHLACSGNQTKLLNMARMFRQKDIPCDNLIIDFEWGDGCDGTKEVKWGSRLDWSASYAEPLTVTEMLDSLKAMHYSVMLINHSAPDFKGRFMQGWTETVYPASIWWQKLQEKLDIGVAGVWQDTRKNNITDARIYKGLLSRTRGLRPWFMGCRKMQAYNPWDEYFCAFPMNSMIGSRRYPFDWTGDCSYSWMELAWQIKAITNTHGAMKGVSYISSDGVAANWKIQARWNQFSALSAVSRSHNPKPWSADFNTAKFIQKIRITGRDTINVINEKPEQAGPVEQLETSIRKHLKLRYSLLPYIYSTAFETYATGIPMTRPMLLEFPQDFLCNGDQWPYQYMLGPSLLVAPVYGDFTSMEIYLPKDSQWIDFWEGTVHNGGNILEKDTKDITTIPLFVRRGAILPRNHEACWIDPAQSEKNIIIDVYPDTMSSFTLYQDDGKTTGYQQGVFRTIEFTCKAEDQNNSVTFNIQKAKGICPALPDTILYTIRMNTMPEPVRVWVNNKPVLRNSVRETSSWVFEKNVLTIKLLANVDRNYLIRVSSK